MTSSISFYGMKTQETITPWFLSTDFSSTQKSRGRGVRAAEVQIQPIFLLTSCSDVVMNYQNAVDTSSAPDQKGSKRLW